MTTSSVGTSSPWSTDSMVSRNNFGLLREQMMSDVVGRLVRVTEFVVVASSCLMTYTDPCYRLTARIVTISGKYSSLMSSSRLDNSSQAIPAKKAMDVRTLPNDRTVI